ncbi:corrinoid protein [Alkalibacter rhizosphaerae]|uniref:Corrinoid protein n=1 Tax=Alkalibacter rhizosphaerae TaxID=2815577 RepID=A0A975AIL4_9FIRM|nr:corrinoid protein [Alkalibacter rhizosphaerae]QSX08799.1 corrinoid protein [Alkalibacter rhizosphaerae]
MSRIKEIQEMVAKGKTKVVAGLVQEALDGGAQPKEILDAMIESMGIVGDKFSAGEIFVPEMLISAKAMSKGVDVLKPLLAGDASTSLGTCVIGTVAGDLHDIGKNLVSMMLESAGFTMIDLGVDVPAAKFVETAKENNAVIVAASGLLTTTMPALKETSLALKDAGFTVIVGGAPVTQAYATEIKADGYAPDAGSAVTKAKELVK